MLVCSWQQHTPISVCVTAAQHAPLKPPPSPHPLTTHDHHAQDDLARYRSVLRSQFLFGKNHSVSHNIITGEARSVPGQVPAAPSRPAQQQRMPL
jgi:hypothetical protein